MCIGLRSLCLMLLATFLFGCGTGGRLPQVRPIPAATERRVSLEIGSLILYDDQPQNIVVFIHKSDDTAVKWFSVYPEDGYIVMRPYDREEIQASFVAVPETQIANTHVIVTIVSVPDDVTQQILSSISAIILDEITSKIPGNRLVQWITTLASDEVASRIQELIEDGQVLEVCDVQLSLDGPPKQICNQYQQRVVISIRQVIAVPEHVLEAQVLDPQSESPISVEAPKAGSVEDEVVNVVRRFNADQTVAVRELNADILRATATGKWLRLQINYIERLRQQNLYEVQQQQGFTIISVRVQEGVAKVVTQEIWRTAKFDRDTNQCKYHQPLFTTTQTYTLVKEGESWKITEDIFEPDAPADIPGC